MRRTALVVLALLSLSACSSGSDDSTVTRPSATPISTGATGSSLSISGFSYQPSALTVAPGATIAVRNSDAQKHTVSSDTAGLFLADEIDKGKLVSFKAPSKPGRYTFHCEYHPSMHGTLVVKG